MKIEHDEKRETFHVRLEEGEGFLEYEKINDHTLDFTTTFVPGAHRGKGIGGRIVREAFAYAREQDLKVIPSCPFVKAYADKNPEYLDVLADS